MFEKAVWLTFVNVTGKKISLRRLFPENADSGKTSICDSVKNIERKLHFWKTPIPRICKDEGKFTLVKLEQL